MEIDKKKGRPNLSLMINHTFIFPPIHFFKKAFLFVAILQHKVAILVDSKYVIKIIFLNLHVNSFFFFRLLISCLKMVFQMLLQITLCVYPINGMINIMLVLLMGILEFCTCYCRFLDDFAQSSHLYKIRKNYFGLSQESYLYGVKVQCPKTP